MIKTKSLFLLAVVALVLSSCISTRPEPEVEKLPVSRVIFDKGSKKPSQLAAFFLDRNPDADKNEILMMANYYVQEASAEGINSDCAFIQMCLETGFLRFGNLVKPEWHNYCGLGAIDAEHPGEIFETPQLGVRAHIQHLHAYGTTADVILKNPCIDRRYKYVNPRGKSPTIAGLSGTWAADPNYSIKLERLLSELEQY